MIKEKVEQIEEIIEKLINKLEDDLRWKIHFRAENMRAIGRQIEDDPLDEKDYLVLDLINKLKLLRRLK